MDPSAPQTVLAGVAITSSLCGIAGGLYGGLKHGTAGKFFMYSAVNSGIVAATFFSIREYVVSPVLALALPGRAYRLRRQIPSFPTGNPMPQEIDPLSWNDIRTSSLLDSAISGGVTGGTLNAWKRGLGRGLAPGLSTGALLCTLFQWCFNEFNILRIHYVSASLTTPAHHPTHGPVLSVQQNSPAESSTPMAMQLPAETPASHSLMDRVLSLFGRRLSDEEYSERLKMERDSRLRRIAELEEKRRQ